MTRAEIEKICLENKLPCGPVCTVPEAMANPTVAARDMLIQVNDPAMGEITMPGIPIKLTNCPGGVEIVQHIRLAKASLKAIRQRNAGHEKK